MSEQGNVSTEETLGISNQMVVTTEENEAPEPNTQEAKPSKDGESQTKDAPAGDQQKPKRDRKHERQVGKLTRRYREAEATGKAQATQLAELIELNKTLNAKVETAPEPQLKDFDTPQEYAKKFAEWETLKTEKPAEVKVKPAPPPKFTDDQRTEIADFEKLGVERLGETFTEAFADTTLPLSVDMFDFIQTSDVGPELIVYLDQHRRVAKRMFGAGDKLEEQMTELEGKMKPSKPETKETEGKKKEVVESKKAPKKAAEVPETVNSQLGTPAFDPETASVEEFKKWRESGGGKN